MGIKEHIIGTQLKWRGFTPLAEKDIDSIDLGIEAGVVARCTRNDMLRVLTQGHGLFVGNSGRTHDLWVMRTRMGKVSRNFAHKTSNQVTYTNDGQAVIFPRAIANLELSGNSLVREFMPGTALKRMYRSRDPEVLERIFSTIQQAHEGFRAVQNRTLPARIVTAAETASWLASRTARWSTQIAANRVIRSHLDLKKLSVLSTIQLASLATNNNSGIACDNLHADNIIVNDTDSTIALVDCEEVGRPMVEVYDLLRSWGHVLLFSAQRKLALETIQTKIAALCRKYPEQASSIRTLWRIRCMGMLTDISRNHKRMEDQDFQKAMRVFIDIINGN